MRETKEQKMIRLERVTGEQKQELIEMRKERKSLKYRVSALERDINDIQTKLDNADFQNEELQAKYRREKAEHDDDVERYERQIERLKLRISQLESIGTGDVRQTIRNIASVKSDMLLNEITLKRFLNGEVYYDDTIYNLSGCGKNANVGVDVLLEKCKTGKKPFFDPEDLIIRINPKTGVALSDDMIAYIKAVLDNEPEYDMALVDVGDYGCFHDGEELDAYAYSKGMVLLELYSDRVF